MPRQYPMVNMPTPAPVDAIGPLRNLVSIAAVAEDMKYRKARRTGEEQQQQSQQTITEALTRSQGKLPDAINSLEQAGRWAEANALRGKQHEIQKGQQEELAARLKATREGFETSTRYLQGLEATPEAERPQLWTSIRPRLVESLPGLAQYVPEQYDPKFLASAIPFGLSAADAAKRRSEATDALNKTFKEGGDKLNRDKAVLEHLSPWLETADTGEEVTEILTTAEALYGASPAVRTRVGEIPTGPLTPEWKQNALARLSGKQDDQTPASFDAAILAARAKGDTAEVDRLLGLKARASAAGREPDKPEKPPRITPAQKAQAERWKQGELAKLEEEIRTGRPGGYDQETGEPITIPIPQTEINARRARIERSYLAQIGEEPAPASGITGRPTPFNVSPTSSAGGDAQAQVQRLLANEPPGTYTLSDGSVWTKAADGTLTPKGR